MSCITTYCGPPTPQSVSTVTHEGVKASGTECTVTLQEIPSAQYCLSHPIRIGVERELSGFVISEPITGVYGYGDNLNTALGRFFEALVSQYEFLTVNQAQLSDSLRAELDSLADMLEPCY